jgi:hypothetical protein
VTGYLLDHTALSALGRGHRQLSRLVSAAGDENEWQVFVPALCLAAAEAERSGMADHIGALPAVEIVDLGFAGAAAVGRLVATGVDWRIAHAAQAGRPTAEWQAGRAVLTAQPDAYAKLGVATVPLRT